MNSQVLIQGSRFLMLLALQVLVLMQVGLQLGPYFSIFIYPAFILFLPREMNTVPILFLSFLMGSMVDYFYVTPGLHASASVFSGYIRSFLLNRFEPRSGYSDALIPSRGHLGWQWFLPVAALFMTAHLLFYFSVDAFVITFGILWSILKKTLVALVLSYAFVLIYSAIFNPKE